MVGIDRIIAEAGVAKATFYHHFKSKDELVTAYLTREYERQRNALADVPGDGVERIEAIFGLLAVLSRGPGFRGCPFLNAAAEFADPSHAVRGVVDDYRGWFRDYMRELLGGRADAAAKAEFLLVMRDGVAVSGGLGDMGAIDAGVATALAVLEVPADA